MPEEEQTAEMNPLVAGIVLALLGFIIICAGAFSLSCLEQLAVICWEAAR